MQGPVERGQRSDFRGQEKSNRRVWKKVFHGVENFFPWCGKPSSPDDGGASRENRPGGGGGAAAGDFLLFEAEDDDAEGDAGDAGPFAEVGAFAQKDKREEGDEDKAELIDGGDFRGFAHLKRAEVTDP